MQTESAVLDFERNQAQYDWLYAHLADEASQMILANIIEYEHLEINFS